MNTKETEAVKWMYSYAMCSVSERKEFKSVRGLSEIEDSKLLELCKDLGDNPILSAYLLYTGKDGIKIILKKLENDIFLSQRDKQIYFAGTPVELNQFIERVLIQYIPEINLNEEYQAKQRALLNVREQFIPQWEETLYRLLLRFVENKREEFKDRYDDVRFKTALHGLSRNELTVHHFAVNDGGVLKAFFVNIGQDDGFISVDGKLQYQGINIEVNELLTKVIVPNIPQNFTAVNYSAQSSASSSSLLGEIKGGFVEVGAVVADFFKTFWYNEEQSNGRQN